MKTYHLKFLSLLMLCTILSCQSSDKNTGGGGPSQPPPQSGDQTRDNCANLHNPDQANTDGGPAGNACDIWILGQGLIGCVPGSADPRCDDLLTCSNPSTDPRCLLDCYPGAGDPRCNPPDCYPGSADVRCTETHLPDCYPGSTDDRCDQTMKDLDCYPGSTDPRCGLSHVIFVSSAPASSGNLKTLTGADQFCQSLASAAGRTGTWKAVLSSSSADAKTRISITKPVKNTGQLVANNSSGLFGSNLINPIRYNEKGEQFERYVWTGSTLSGLKSSHHCNSWKSGLWTDKGQAGYSGSRKAPISSGSPISCDANAMSVYCISQ